ncbi:MAG: hypothetical protein M3458_02270 [Acidobacteriota bacterium]|nr:hypothetical protein [Acidobacteriota bacterium]
MVRLILSHKIRIALAAILTLLLISALLAGCSQKIPAEYKWFFDLPLDRQHDEVRKLPVEQQMDIYFVAMGRHPPDKGFAYDIADSGVKALPALIHRLEAEDSEFNQLYILDVLEIMAERGYLQNRQETVARLRRIVTQMKYQTTKQDGLKVLANIERHSVQ